MNLRKNFSALFFVVNLVCISAGNSWASVSGDCDGDGVVRLADALQVLRHVAGTQPFGFYEIFYCDVFGGGGPLPSPDGFCEITDALFILDKAYGLINY